MVHNVLKLILREPSIYSSPPQLRYPQLRYFRSYAILNWVQKKLKLSYFLIFPPVTVTLYVLEEKIV